MIDLKNFSVACGFEIIRDAVVETLGLMDDRRHAVLAPIYDVSGLAELARNPSIAMVLTTPALASSVLASPVLASPVPQLCGVAVCNDPLESFYALHGLLFDAGHYSTQFRTHSQAHSGAGSDNQIATDARIHPRACIASRDVRIGVGAVIGPNAVIEERTVIGDHCTIGPGSVIGAEGFQVRRVSCSGTLGGRRQLVVPHGGGVRIGSNVTIQANVVVDRALFGGFTDIGDGTVIGDLVCVAHGVSIGRCCRIVACTIIGGSTVVGDDSWLGLNATVSNSLHLGDGARITMGAVVTRNVLPGGHVSGNFAVEHGRLLAHLRSVR